MRGPRSDSVVQAIAQFDGAFDDGLERLRGHPVADRVFRTASELGDFSVIWLLLGAAWGLSSARRTDRALRTVVLVGAESLVVNQGIKRLFGRTRPTEAGDPRYPVRRPYTSSFPSGHSSAGFFAATLLTESEPALGAPLVRPGRGGGHLARLRPHPPRLGRRSRRGDRPGPGRNSQAAVASPLSHAQEPARPPFSGGIPLRPTGLHELCH